MMSIRSDRSGPSGFVCDVEPASVKVHFVGFAKKFDEWIARDSKRIRPFRYGKRKRREQNGVLQEKRVPLSELSGYDTYPNEEERFNRTILDMFSSREVCLVLDFVLSKVRVMVIVYFAALLVKSTSMMRYLQRTIQRRRIDVRVVLFYIASCLHTLSLTHTYTHTQSGTDLRRELYESTSTSLQTVHRRSSCANSTKWKTRKSREQSDRR